MNKLNLVNFFAIVVVCALSGAEAFRLARSTGGFFAKENEYKYVVAIKINGETPCSGGILNDKYVLTAAHCVVDVNTNKVFAGSVQVTAAVKQLKNPEPNAFSVAVKKVYLPVVDGETWSSGKITGDIAVLELAESLNLAKNDNVEALTLPKHDSDYLHDNTTTYQVTGYGWEYTYFDRNGRDYDPLYAHAKVTGKMRWANVKFATVENCTGYYESLIDETHVCGKFINFQFTDICRGDGGSPLVLGETNEVVAVVTAASYHCNSFAAPSVYTRVDAYLDFIKSVLENEDAADVHVEEVRQAEDGENSGKLTCWLPNKHITDKVIYSDMCTLQEVTGKTYNDDVFLSYEIDTFFGPVTTGESVE